MTNRPSYQNPPTAVATSPDPEKPLELTVIPGTPVFDTRDEVHGKVFAVTPAFCVMLVQHTETLCIAKWEHIAVANVCPARTMIPANTVQQDRLNAYAAIMRELEGLKQFGMLPILNLARKELIWQLKRIHSLPQPEPSDPRRKRKGRGSRRKGSSKGRGKRA